MSLIKCPECGSSVSTYAHACPNCGFPMDVNKSDTPEVFDISIIGRVNNNQKLCLASLWFLRDIRGGDLDIEEINSSSFPSKIVTGLSKCNAENVSNTLIKFGYTIDISSNTDSSGYSKYNDNVTKYFESTNGKITCPVCGSPNISIGSRGYSILLGFVGSNTTTNRCGRCGHKWNP